MSINARQWDLLTMIPNFGNPITTSDLVERLQPIHGQDESRSSFARKIQHDINALSLVVKHLHVVKPKRYREQGLDQPSSGLTDSRETRISWKKDAPALRVAGLSTPEVLAFGVLQRVGANLMPKTLHASLQPFFNAAADEAANQMEVQRPFNDVRSSNSEKRWLKKIHFIADQMSFVEPAVRPEVELLVHEALMHEKSLEIAYRDKTRVVIHPQALVQRGVRCYLIAKPKGSDTAKTYAMHRIVSAREHYDRYEGIKNFDLQDYLLKGIANPIFPAEQYGKKVRLDLAVNAGTAHWLIESPLSKDQTLEQSGRGYSVTASVIVTEELVWWLLSMGSNVKVLGPELIVKRVKDELEKAAKLYRPGKGGLID
jgi:predicted DNA-binding transcriptional regulator YafY